MSDGLAAARDLVDQWAVRVAGWWPSQDQSEELARAMLALAESHPSDGLAAAVIEWADSEQVVRQNPSPSREEWHRVLVARERLREFRAALTEPDSAETPNP